MKKYKGVLLDIDNTLYPYSVNHKRALSACIENIASRHGFAESFVKEAFCKGREEVKLELGEMAAAHNRLLYFKRMCEILSLNSLREASPLYELYWDVFIDGIEPFEKMDVFMASLSDKKIVFLTDLTADIQLRKIKKLGLQDSADFLVTSEEAGYDKPHPHMFLHALHKLRMNVNDVVMIGDNINRDIRGASRLGIDSIWIWPVPSDRSLPDKCRQVTTMEELYELFKEGAFAKRDG